MNSKFSSENFCLVGLGVLFEETYFQIQEIIGKKPHFVFDNSKDKWGQTFNNIVCLNLNQLNELDKKTNIIICVRNFEIIVNQMEAMGFLNIYLVKFERGINIVKKIDKVCLLEKNNISSSLDVNNKWTLITGSSRGIGFKIATEMAKLGSNLILQATNEENLSPILEQVAKYNIKTLTKSANFLDEYSLHEFIKWMDERIPIIDFAYLNAGISIEAPAGFWGMKYSDFQDSFKVNSIAPIKIAQTILPKMIKADFGRIIITSSSIQKRSGEMAYACSKAAIDKFVYDLSPSLTSKKVMMILMDPGWIQTDMGGKNATKTIDTLYPGVLLPALINGDLNGKWISVQDYVNYTLEKAINKAFFLEEIKELKNE